MTHQDLSSTSHLLEHAHRILLVAGPNAGGEVLGSLVALYRGLGALGRKVAAFCPGPISGLLRELIPELERVDSRPPEGPFAAVLVLGGAFPDGLPQTLELALRGAAMAELAAADSEPAGQATMAQRTLEILDSLGAPLDRETARALYVALACATDSFQNRQVTPGTHVCAARLLDFGVPTDLVGRRLFREDSFEFLQLLGLVLRRLEVAQGGLVAHSEVRRSDSLARTLTDQDFRLLVDRVDLVRGGEVTVLCHELEDGTVRVNLRSRRFPMRDVATRLGGQGDAQNATCLVPGPLSVARTLVLGELARCQDQLRNSG